MRRLPIYFLIDVSESMVGDPIAHVQDGIASIVKELRQDPYALETAFISIIAFAGKAKVLVPLTELYMFYPVNFPIGGGTSLGGALDYLMDDIDHSIQTTTIVQKGDWKPIVFLFTDGMPTDNVDTSFQRWNAKYRTKANLIAISLGDNIDTSLLGRITDNVLLLNNTDADSYKQFFKWVTASIKTSSVSVAEANDDGLKIAELPDANLTKINLEKQRPIIIDEQFAVILARCQTTKQPYLIKYYRRIKPMDIPGLEEYNVSDYKLVGAYPIEEKIYKELSYSNENLNKINTSSLIGAPTCPCCGNQFGFVTCECGKVFCVGEESHSQCPWCGLEGKLGIAEGGTNITKTRG